MNNLPLFVVHASCAIIIFFSVKTKDTGRNYSLPRTGTVEQWKNVCIFSGERNEKMRCG